jgi:hypothetical protein
MSRKFALLLIAGLLLATSALYAQDEPETEYEVSVWNAVEVVDGEPVEPEADDLPLTVTFLTPDNGETLIAVWSGPDIVYTRAEGDTYSGVTLVSEEAYEFEATLEVIDRKPCKAPPRLMRARFPRRVFIVMSLVKIPYLSDLYRRRAHHPRIQPIAGMFGSHQC